MSGKEQTLYRETANADTIFVSHFSIQPRLRSQYAFSYEGDRLHPLESYIHIILILQGYNNCSRYHTVRMETFRCTYYQL